MKEQIRQILDYCIDLNVHWDGKCEWLTRDLDKERAATEIEIFIEKLIEERIPTKEEMEFEIDQNPMDMVYAGGFAECYEWFRYKMKGGEK